MGIFFLLFPSNLSVFFLSVRNAEALAARAPAVFFFSSPFFTAASAVGGGRLALMGAVKVGELAAGAKGGARMGRRMGREGESWPLVWGEAIGFLDGSQRG